MSRYLKQSIGLLVLAVCLASCGSPQGATSSEGTSVTPGGSSSSLEQVTDRLLAANESDPNSVISVASAYLGGAGQVAQRAMELDQVLLINCDSNICKIKRK